MGKKASKRKPVTTRRSAQQLQYPLWLQVLAVLRIMRGERNSQVCRELGVARESTSRTWSTQKKFLNLAKEAEEWIVVNGYVDAKVQKLQTSVKKFLRQIYNVKSSSSSDDSGESTPVEIQLVPNSGARDRRNSSGSDGSGILNNVEVTVDIHHPANENRELEIAAGPSTPGSSQRAAHHLALSIADMLQRDLDGISVLQHDENVVDPQMTRARESSDEELAITVPSLPTITSSVLDPDENPVSLELRQAIDDELQESTNN